MSPRFAAAGAAGALFCLATASSADEANLPETARAPFVIGVEASTAFYSETARFDFDGSNSEDMPSVSGAGGSLSAGGFGLYSLSRSLSVGPRLAVTAGIPPTYLTGGYFVAEAGVIGLLRFDSKDRTGPVPRIVYGASGAWATFAAPPSFAIEHDVAPALGLCSMIGLGADWASRPAVRRWSVDLKALACHFNHDHSMRDTRTGEREEGSVQVWRFGLLLTLGVGWFVGGGS